MCARAWRQLGWRSKDLRAGPEPMDPPAGPGQRARLAQAGLPEQLDPLAAQDLRGPPGPRGPPVQQALLDPPAAPGQPELLARPEPRDLSALRAPLPGI